MIITIRKISNAVTNSPTKRLADIATTEHITKSAITAIIRKAEKTPQMILTAIGSFLLDGTSQTISKKISKIISITNSTVKPPAKI